MSDILTAFQIALGFKVDEAAAKKAEATADRVEKTVTEADKRTTAAQASGAALRILQADREAGVRTKGAAAYISELKQKEKAVAALTEAEKKAAAALAEAEKEAAAKRRERTREFAAAVDRMALAAAAAATAIAYAFGRVTGAYDNLNFVSQRTGASVQSLKALQYAFSQTGSTAGNAVSAVESFAKAMRENDGIKTFVKGLGVDTTKDMADQLLDTVEKLSEHEYQVGFREAGLAGISEENYNLISRQLAAIKQYRAEQDAANKALGVNSEHAAQASSSFQRTLTRLQATATALADKLLIQLAPALERVAKGFNDWIAANPEKVDRIVRNITDGITWLAQKLTALVEWFGGDGGESFLKRWDEFAGRVTALGHGFDEVWKKFRSIDDWLSDSKIYQFLKWYAGGGALSFSPAGALYDKMTGQGNGGAASAGIITPDDRTAYQKIAPKWLGGKDAPGAGGNGAIGKTRQNENSAAVMEEFKKSGLPAEGVAALMGSTQTESGFNPRARNNVAGGHTGLLQWDSTRWPKIEQWIRSQGGEPYDARWQARAAIAEGQAKRGDPLYDHPRTERGWKALEGSAGDLGKAMDGIRDIERYGAGEEGGRGANARGWLPHVNGAQSAGGDVAGGFHPLGGKGRLTSDISRARVNPITGQTRPHNGIDLAAPAGTDVKAMQAGLVSLGSSGDITIKQGDGSSTTYRHVVPSVADGARVAAGAIIAQLKAHDPRSTGPHLHLEARDKEGSLLDPKTLLAPAPKQDRNATPTPVAPRPVAPIGAPGAFDVNRIDPQAATQPAGPLGANSVTNNSSNRAINQTINNHVKVDGSRDPREHGRIIESSLSRVHGLALENAQSALV